MGKNKKFLIILFILIIFGAVYLFFVGEKIARRGANILIMENDAPDLNLGGVEIENEIKKDIVEKKETEDAPKDGIKENIKTTEEAPRATEALKINYQVPFTPQAPFGEWDNPIFQDGCEEAAVLMAVSWGRGEMLSAEKAKKEIMAASSYEKENYGDFLDTSIADTLERVINGYFKYKKAEIKINISIDDIISELASGNLVILPMNGQLLKNPYYTPPGPERHNIVVIGYDEETMEFITNDPGTKRGAGFRYNEEVLFSAIQDYPTGNHEPIEKVKKNMIIVAKE